LPPGEPRMPPLSSRLDDVLAESFLSRFEFAISLPPAKVNTTLSHVKKASDMPFRS
jgi:hypothetical protein